MTDNYMFFFWIFQYSFIKFTRDAGLAQLVEHLLAKEKVEGSSLLTRSKKAQRSTLWAFLFGTDIFTGNIC